MKFSSTATGSGASKSSGTAKRLRSVPAKLITFVAIHRNPVSGCTCSFEQPRRGAHNRELDPAQRGAALTEHEPLKASRAAGKRRLGSWRRDLVDQVKLSLVAARMLLCAGARLVKNVLPAQRGG